MNRFSRIARSLVAVAVAIAALVASPAVDSARAELDASTIQSRASSSTPLQYHYPEQYAPAVEMLEERSGEAVDRLRRRLGLETFPQVDVWVLPEVGDYFELEGHRGRAPKWAIGLSLGSEHTVIVARDTRMPGGRQSDLEKTFVHELAHVAVDIARGGNHVPRWFNEGFALMQAREWTPERREQLARAASTGALIPLSDLDRDFPGHHRVASLAYAESFHFVRHLQERHGEGVTAEIMTSVREGIAFEVAVEQATGRSLAAIESAWREEITSETSWLALLGDEFAIFFGATVLFVIAWVVRRSRIRQRAESAEEDEGDWTYDESRYPLPGRPRDS